MKQGAKLHSIGIGHEQCGCVSTWCVIALVRPEGTAKLAMVFRYTWLWLLAELEVGYHRWHQSPTRGVSCQSDMRVTGGLHVGHEWRYIPHG